MNLLNKSRKLLSQLSIWAMQELSNVYYHEAVRRLIRIIGYSFTNDQLLCGDVGQAVDEAYKVSSSTATVLRLFGEGKSLDSIVSPTTGLSIGF